MTKQEKQRSTTHETEVIPVMEETLSVRKRQTEVGKMRITKRVHEEDVFVDQAVWQERIHVERVAVDRFVDGPIPIRQEGDTMIIPVLEEVLVVEKRLLLKEEIHVTTQRQEVHNPQEITLRREEATVERFPSHQAKE